MQGPFSASPVRLLTFRRRMRCHRLRFCIIRLWERVLGAGDSSTSLAVTGNSTVAAGRVPRCSHTARSLHQPGGVAGVARPVPREKFASHLPQEQRLLWG